jgi:hypothetical protein
MSRSMTTLAMQRKKANVIAFQLLCHHTCSKHFEPMCVALSCVWF